MPVLIPCSGLTLQLNAVLEYFSHRHVLQRYTMGERVLKSFKTFFMQTMHKRDDVWGPSSCKAIIGRYYYSGEMIFLWVLFYPMPYYMLLPVNEYSWPSKQEAMFGCVLYLQVVHLGWILCFWLHIYTYKRMDDCGFCYRLHDVVIDCRMNSGTVVSRIWSFLGGAKTSSFRYCIV